MKKLWVVSELFYPDETSTAFILTKVANKLVEKYNIEVFCGTPEELGDFTCKNNLKVDSRVKVERLRSKHFDKNNLKLRSLHSILFSFQIFFKLLLNSKRTDKVLMITNPVTSIPLIAFAKKLKKFDLTILVHDVFPENTIPAGILKSKNSLVFRILKNIFDWSYSSSNQIIVLGRDMEKILFEKICRFKTKTNIEIIENWADIMQIFPQKKEMLLQPESPLLHHVVFQYAGNIGRVQGLMDLLEIIENVDNSKLFFSFIGEGALKQSMINFVEQHNIKNVEFSGSYSRKDQNDILNKTDIAIVTLANGMLGLGVPSKVYNILAAGKAIFYLGDPESEVFMLIKEHNVGYGIDYRNKNEILSFLKNFNDNDIDDLKVKGDNARKLAENFYSEDKILEKFLKTI